MDTDRYEKEKKFWEKFAPRYDPFIIRLKRTYDALLGHIGPYLDSSKSVLEIATGTGTVALAIAPGVRMVRACDISGEMIRIARDKLRASGLDNVEFDVQDAYHLNYESESFDLAIASNVLHVMFDPRQALSSVRGMLKPGGLLIAPTYCHGDSLKARMVSSLMSLSGFKAHQKWSVVSYRSFMESNGFELVEYTVVPDIIPLAFSVVRKTG